MQQDEVIELFQNSGALLHGHFVLSSGLHSSVYLQCAIGLQWPSVAAKFGSAIADQFRSQQIETVASPAIGGLIIGYEVARHLNVRFIWTERENGVMTVIADWPHVPRQTEVQEEIDTSRNGYVTFLLCTPTSIMPAGGHSGARESGYGLLRRK